jgi:biopolymer transport protein ExbB
MDLLKIFHDMDGFSTGIVATLLLMATASLSILMERLWTYRRAAAETKRFVADAGALLTKNAYNDLLQHAEKHKASPFGWLVAEATRFFLQARMTPGRVPLVERVRRDVDRKLDAVAADLKRGHSVLASVGSVAPFVGLLGTVVGIIASFQSIAKEGSGGLGVVSAGISEALIVTALGLVVAIPSVLAFNLLTSRADKIVAELERSRGEFLDHLEHTAIEVVHSEQARAA